MILINTSSVIHNAAKPLRKGTHSACYRVRMHGLFNYLIYIYSTHTYRYAGTTW